MTGSNTAASISGQGGLATKNQADWDTEVGGTGKPANNADVTDYAAAAATAQQKADEAQTAAENYTNIREQAMIDGVITDAEQGAIDAAAIDATNKANAAESAAESAAQIYTEGWSAENADVTDYADRRVASAIEEAGGISILRPEGGRYKSGSSSEVGYIKIKLPQYYTSTMLRFTVDVYEYQSDRSFNLVVGGYTNSGNDTWLQTSAILSGSIAANNTVTFGHDGDTCCIWIGLPGTSWRYVDVQVKDFQAGYSNYQISQWASGWTVSIDSTAPVQSDRVISDALLDARSVVGQGSLATLNSVDWNSTLDSIPDRFKDSITPQVAANGGLVLTDLGMGYYSAVLGDYQSYIGGDGNFHFGGDANNFIDFNGTQLVIDTDNFSVDGAGNASFSGDVSSGKTSLADTTAGYYLDSSGDMAIGDADTSMTFSSTGGITLEGSVIQSKDGKFVIDLVNKFISIEV